MWSVLIIMVALTPQSVVHPADGGRAVEAWPTPFAHLVPREKVANLRFRQQLHELCKTDPDAQRDVWIMCKRDPLYWLNTWCWIYEPRRAAKLPWITFDFQDVAYAQWAADIGVRDLGVDKSRDMAASWGVLAMMCWRFQFYGDWKQLLVSRTEYLVDRADDPDCLMWKLDFLLATQPKWLQPVVKRTHLKLKNEVNKSIITGTATVEDVSRGGRQMFIFFDEFAFLRAGDDKAMQKAAQSATDSRGYVSTPNGAVNEFYRVMHGEDLNMHRYRLHWSCHPYKRPGLYTTEDNAVKILDPDYVYPEDYPFILDGKLRSPKYDYEEKRPGATPESMAQEWDIAYHGSDYPFFSIPKLDAYERQHCRDPWECGELAGAEVDGFDGAFEPNPRGRLRIWSPLTANGKLPPRRYVAGADIATGTGASNSVCAVYDRLTGELAAELVSPHMTPEAFANYVVALCRWCFDAELIWEANGPGRAFEKRVLALDYRRIYYRDTSAAERLAYKKTSQVPGWWNTPEAFRLLLDLYRANLDRGGLVNYSREAVQECRDYKYLTTGQVAHAGSVITDDPSGAKANHGDRVVAHALASKLLGEIGRQKETEAPREVPAGSPYARMQRRRARAAARSAWGLNWTHEPEVRRVH